MPILEVPVLAAMVIGTRGQLWVPGQQGQAGSQRLE